MAGHRALGSLSVQSINRLMLVKRFLLHSKVSHLGVMLGAFLLGWIAQEQLARIFAHKDTAIASVEQIEFMLPPVNIQAENSQMLLGFYEFLKDEPGATLPAYSVDRLDAKPVFYLLQAGLFRQKKVVKARQKRLHKLGLQTQVESDLDAQKEAFYRVIVGPFEDRYSLLSAQRRLTEAQIENLLIVMPYKDEASVQANAEVEVEVKAEIKAQ